MLKSFFVAMAIISGLGSGFAIEDDGYPAIIIKNTPDLKWVACGVRIVAFNVGHRMVGTTNGSSIVPEFFDKADRALMKVFSVASGLSSVEGLPDNSVVKVDRIESVVIRFARFLWLKPRTEYSAYLIEREFYPIWLRGQNGTFRPYFYEHSKDIGYCDSLNYDEETLYEVVTDFVNSRLESYPEGGILENGIDLIYCNVKKYRWALNVIDELKQMFFAKAGCGACEGSTKSSIEV
ncbi:MAG: hypothetical protein LBQ43_02630 [Holosporales bacterium]|nr:hypothetical protein [Holosporales bacterium]